MLIWIIYLIVPAAGFLQVPNSPAFPDKPSCEEVRQNVDPYFQGKTFCWPSPYKYEGGSASVRNPPVGEHVD